MHEGHRQRLDEKVRLFGFEGLEEHEQLELLLFTVIPRKNTNHMAHELLERFGTIGGVLSADVSELEKVEGVGHRVAVFLNTLPGLLGAIQRSSVKQKKLKEQKELEKYVQSFFHNKLIEMAYVFFLNSHDGIISYEKISEGVASETYIYPSLVARKAVLARASKVVLAHNHPCGLSKPSQQDINITRRVLKALDAVDVEFKDSIIVAHGECYSMDAHNYLIIDDITY